MTVVLDGKASEGMAYVDDAMTTPELPRDMAVPDMVRAGLPSVSVVPAMATAVGFAVKAWPPRVKMWVDSDATLADDG